MKTKTYILAAALLATTATACSGTSDPTTTAPEQTTTTAADEFSLDDVVDEMVAEDSIPGIAALVFTDAEILDQAVAGVRQNGGSDAMTLDDRFHIGSNTKALTAALIGRLVERGDLSFDTTLGEIFADLPTIDSSLQDATIRQLLSHTAGIDDIAVMESGVEDVIDGDSDTPAEQRAEATEFLLALPSGDSPGAGWAYSNVGYALVGAAAESLTGLSFSELMELEVFEPLGITTCDFGTPTHATGLPLGHDADNQPVPLDAVEDSDVLSPAGSVTYCTLDGWVRFLQEMMRAHNGESDWLSAETIETMVTPVLQDYALGWGVFEVSDRLSFTHDGSNTLNYSTAWITPAENIGWVVVTNAGAEAGGLASNLVSYQIDLNYLEQ